MQEKSHDFNPLSFSGYTIVIAKTKNAQMLLVLQMVHEIARV